MTNGVPICWGDNALGQTSPPEGTLLSLELGARHAFGLAPDGSTIPCWGDNVHGQADGYP